MQYINPEDLNRDDPEFLFILLREGLDKIQEKRLQELSALELAGELTEDENLELNTFKALLDNRSVLRFRARVLLREIGFEVD